MLDMQAEREYTECMKSLQYTIRGVNPSMDEVLRKMAVREGNSLNSQVLDVIRKGLNMGVGGIRYDDLDDLAGKWTNDPEFDKAMDAMDKVDEELWK